MNIETERLRTRPEYTVYVPKSLDGSTHDTGNEHFLVFESPDGGLAAVWTQSTAEGEPDQRIVFARSGDEGRSWTPPRVIAGPAPAADGGLASWGFPLVSNSGRIYVIYNQHIGVNDLFTHTTGLMAGIYSDDAGQTWSEAQVIPMRRSKWDSPNASIPSNWIVWQKPQRLSEGKYLVGLTRWVSPAVRHPPPIAHWTAAESVVEFMHFENVDDDPEPRKMVIRNFAPDDEALRVALPDYPEVSVAQEPSIVALPDGRLFTAMRTQTGHPFCSVSDDAGRTWSRPQIMRRHDGGPQLLHPLSPCPIYALGEGRYIFLHHNHDGHFERYGPLDTSDHRRPITLCLGEYRAGAEQPIWFSAPKHLMDNDGVPIGYGMGRCDLAMYSSFTDRGGRRVLWYPDRKFFLLGKVIPNETLAGLTVPA